jgi:predicted transglutaminase-like cysteine proteinase
MDRLRTALLCLLLIELAGCAAVEPPLVSMSMTSPTASGWIEFCRLHDASPTACDPIPPATAMHDTRPAMAPVAWHDYCRRHPEDAACTN